MSLLLAASLLLKAVAIVLLGRIAWTDFSTQRISNRDVMLLLCLGLGLLGRQHDVVLVWVEAAGPWPFPIGRAR